MNIATIKVSGVKAVTNDYPTIPAGIVGATVTFEFTDPAWDGLNKTAVFRGCVTRDVLMTGNVVRIPAETVAQACPFLFVGVYGTDAADNLVIPTLWLSLGTVRDAADPSGDPGTDPDLPIWAQLQGRVEALESGAPSDPDAPVTPGQPGKPGEDGGYYTPAVTQPSSDTVEFAFSPSKPDMPAVDPVQVKLPVGQGSGGNVDLTGYATEQYVKDYAQPKGNYLTEVPEGYAKTEDIPTKPEDIGAQPSGNYLTEVPSGYATEEFVKNKIAEAELGGEEVDLSGYAQKSELPTKVSQLQNDSGYLTEHQDISGKLDASALPAAINTALAQAKASGEFDGKDGQDGAPGEKGDKGDKGDPGEPGQKGEQGIQGIPGEKGDKGDKGDTGAPGADGAKGDKGDKGDTGATGAQGEPGKDGADGKDGTSATHSWNGTVLTITSASGTSSADLKGAKGDKGDKGDTGAQGIQGIQGEPGAKGDTGATGAAGKDGKTPVKGTDYFTADDKAEMVEAVKNAYSSDTSWLEGYDIPKLYLTGDTTGMSKDVAVTLNWVYGENSGSCTLKWQGNSSLAYDKKNYTIKLDNAVDIGYGAQKKYVLKANYIDFSHARNIVSARIWGMMVASRKNIIGKLASSPNYGAVNGFPVAIMLNGKFHGLYTFNIPKDGWMMNMGSGTQECILCADHSTATQFKGEASLVGETDFEVEYITDENNTAWAKTAVNRLINACINSNGGDLDTTVAQYLDWESAIDYYILVALVDGHDMTDKNYLLSTYDGTKWFFGAYDMDSTYGLKWDGSYFSKASYGDHTSFVNYANTHRVMELIKRFKTNALKARYAELRADVLSESTIAREFERFACSIPSRLLDEDRNVWPMLPCTSVNNTFQILCWLDRRLEYVDKWMEELPAQEEPPKATYTNLVPTAIGTDGNIYNGTGYRDDYRLSSGGAAEKAQTGSVLTGFIPVENANAIIRVKGVQILHSQETTGGYHCYFALYDSSKTAKGYSTVDNFQSGATGVYDLAYDESTGVYTIGISKMSGSYPGYFRLNAQGKGADLIVTVNEEIK